MPETCKFANSRGTQSIPESFKIHLLYIKMFMYFRVPVRKSETLLRGNRYKASCHILEVLFYVEYAVFMAYHPKSNHSSHCHHSFHIDHIFSLYMFLPGPATKQKQRGNPEFKGFAPHQRHMLQSGSQQKSTVAEMLITNL